jgi:hypothetical protein
MIPSSANRIFLGGLGILFFRALIAVLPATAENLKYGTGSWDSETLGSHRAVINVPYKAEAIWVHIPWRRRDLNPDTKKLIIVEAGTGTRVKFILAPDIQREYRELVFQPITTPGNYYVYYLPYERAPSWGSYPDYVYPRPESLLSSGDMFVYQSWLRRNGLTADHLAK